MDDISNNMLTVHGCVLLLNVIGGFILMLCGQGFSVFGLAILYLILFTPFSFMCWFRPAYRAFKYVYKSVLGIIELKKIRNKN
jgi:hypothetical protein